MKEEQRKKKERIAKLKKEREQRQKISFPSKDRFSH